jgi:hypothetical protein
VTGLGESGVLTVVGDLELGGWATPDGVEVTVHGTVRVATG